jgi:hypothetical protein
MGPLRPSEDHVCREQRQVNAPHHRELSQELEDDLHRFVLYPLLGLYDEHPGDYACSSWACALAQGALLGKFRVLSSISMFSIVNEQLT